MEMENRRSSPRYSVSLYAEQPEPKNAPVRILDMSASGFLVRGDICAGTGGVFHASFNLRSGPSQVRVSTRGTVMHSRPCGNEREYGIRIDTFDSPADESAYKAYVLELAERSSPSP